MAQVQPPPPHAPFAAAPGPQAGPPSRRTLRVALVLVVVGFVALASALVVWRVTAGDSDDGGSTDAAPSPAAIEDGATSVLLAPTDGDVDAVAAAGIAALLDQRLVGTGAVVTVEAAGVRVVFPAPPGSDVIAHLTDPAVTELRPVLATTGPDAQPADADAESSSGATGDPTSPSDIDYYLTAQTLAALAELDCAAGDAEPFVSPEGALVTCDAAGTAKYALGPVEVTGDMIAEVAIDPQALASGAALNEVVVTMTLDTRGATALELATSRLAALAPPADQLAIVVDGTVASAPTVAQAITGGELWLSGGEDQTTFAGLVAQLLFGRQGTTWQIASSTA